VAALAGKDRDTNARPNIPQAHRLVLGSGKQKAGALWVRVQVVDRVAVAHERRAHAARAQVNDLDDAQLARRYDERRARLLVSRPGQREELFLAVLVRVVLQRLHAAVCVVAVHGHLRAPSPRISTERCGKHEAKKGQGTTRSLRAHSCAAARREQVLVAEVDRVELH
jgi:hypothetical protein